MNVSIPTRSINYNLKENGTVVFNYSSYETDTLHFEVDYENITGSVFRYIRMDLVEPVIRVGIAKEQQFYQQLVYSSSSTKKCAIKNVFANAYVMADITRFTYGDAYMTNTYTIDKLYYLYTFDDDGNKVILSSLDGSQSISTNLDVLEFANQTYDFGILGEDIAFSRYNNETIMMYYMNLQGDNENVKIEIYNNDTKIFSHLETDFPNNVTIYFNYLTLSLDGSMIKIVVTSTKDDSSSHSFTRWYNLDENRITQDDTNSAVMIVIAILIAVFGLTFVSVNYIFGFFGIVTLLISIAITTIVGSVWYVLLVQVVLVILLVFTILVYKFEGRVVT